jgi:hypothetical protein
MGNCFSKIKLCCLENSNIKPILELECPKIYKKDDMVLYFLSEEAEI